MNATCELPKLLNADDRAWAASVLPRMETKFSAECDRIGGHIPYIADEGVYRDLKDVSDPAWWTNGFWPGTMWQMYHLTGDTRYLNAAREAGDRIAALIEDDFEGLHHDVGFMWLLSAVADWRLTGDAHARARGLAAATLLAGRFNPSGCFIRAWNGDDNTGWAIIDSMMNIQILFWASEQTGDPRFATVARMHADTLLGTAVREDGSCNHIVELDANTGSLLATPGGQGYASGSSWARGQAWGVYGFALTARHTGEQRYLGASKRIANYLCANMALHDDLAPIDFRAPELPDWRDALVNVIAANGLLELTGLVSELERPFYIRWAMRLLRAVERSWCDWDPSKDGLVQCCSGSYHSETDREVPMVYADYFMLEAVLRLTGGNADLW